MRNPFSPSLSMRATLRKYTGGFTLVELIVVITILAILSAIWLLSFSGYSSGARDSTRVEDLANMQKSLAISATTSVNGKYPTPDNGVSILNSGVLLRTQGYAGKTTLANIKFNGAGLDPLDNQYYTYSVNSTQTWFALMAYLENASNLTLTSYIEKGLAATTDYSTRFPMVQGNPIGILIASGSLQPLQASGSGVDVGTNTTTPYVVYLSPKSTYTGTGAGIVSSINSGIGVYNPLVAYTTGQQFGQSGAVVTVSATGLGSANTKALSGCDTNDIVVWSGSMIQVWSACNIGATTASATLSATSSGAFYQWGRNDDVTAGTFIAWVTGHVNASEFNNNTLSTGNNLFYAGDATNGEWYFPDIGVTPTNRWVLNNQWPCPTGYYIPTWGTNTTSTDWGTLYTIFSGSYTTIESYIKLPRSGNRTIATGTYSVQGSYSYYWSSSPRSTSDSFYASFGGTTDIKNYAGRAYGFSIRCIRR